MSQFYSLYAAAFLLFCIPTQAQNILWSEDFSNGIPGTWGNTGIDGAGTADSDFEWNYRGPNTSPSSTVGPRVYNFYGPVIQSPTAQNGHVIAEANHYLNVSTNTNKQGHQSHLTTGFIDLSGQPNAYLEFYFTSQISASEFWIEFSTNGGFTWTDSMQVFPHPQQFTNYISGKGEVFRTDISNILGNQPTALIRFSFMNKPQSAGLYVTLDDIKIVDAPIRELVILKDNRSLQNQGWGLIDTLSGRSAPNYGFIPSYSDLSLDFHVEIQNNGSVIETGLEAYLDVYNTTTGTSSLNNPFTLLNDSVLPYYYQFSQSIAGVSGGGIGEYNYVRRIKSDSLALGTTTGMTDTIQLSLTDSLYGLDHGPRSNFMDHTNLGPDGYKIANMYIFPRDQSISIRSIYVGLGPGTKPGAGLTLSAVDTTGFTFSNGFPAQPKFSFNYQITATDVAQGYALVDLSSLPDSHTRFYPAESIGYFFIAEANTSGGTNTVEFVNDSSVAQPQTASLFYYTLTSPRWYSGFVGNLTVNAWHLRLGGSISTVGVEESDAQLDVKVYPNPASDHIQVTAEKITSVQLVDMNGSLVSDHTFHNEKEVRISLDGLAEGNYILRVNGEAAELIVVAGR